MKKIIAIIITSTLLLTFTGCGKTNSNASNKFVPEEIMWTSEIVTYDEMTEEISEDLKQPVIKTIHQYENESTNQLQYVSLQKIFEVSSTYSPAVQFFLLANVEDGEIQSIEKIVSVTLDRDNFSETNTAAKQYNGDLFYFLQDNNNIYFIVNGDFYDYGETTGGKSRSVGIDEPYTFQYTIENGLMHSDYCFYDSLITIE